MSGRVRAAPRAHDTVVDGRGGRARPPLRFRGGVSGTQAVRHPEVLAQARARAGGSARRVLARHPRHHTHALAADAAGHVPAPGTRAVRHLTRRNDPLGSIGWTERTGGVLTTRECVMLAPALLRGELGI